MLISINKRNFRSSGDSVVISYFKVKFPPWDTLRICFLSLTVASEVRIQYNDYIGRLFRFEARLW